MKRFFRTLAFVAFAAVAVTSISSCKTDEDDDDNNKSANKTEQMSGTSPKAFYNGLTNNVSNTILLDTRTAEKYAKSHIKYNSLEAISKPLPDDIFGADKNHQFYKDIEAMDPSHSKFILVCDEGASPLVLKVTGILSAMGWGKEKMFLLMNATDKFLEEYPDLDSSKQ